MTRGALFCPSLNTTDGPLEALERAMSTPPEKQSNLQCLWLVPEEVVQPSDGGGAEDTYTGLAISYTATPREWLAVVVPTAGLSGFNAEQTIE